MSNLLEKASILLTPTAYDDGSILSVKPIDGSGDFDFTRNSSATRVNSAGLIESLQTLSSNLVSNGDFSQEGSELITNGDFATDTNWTKGTGWSISGGAASCDGTQTAGTQLVQNGTYTLNKTYKITYTLSSVTAGNIDVRLQGSGATVTGNSRTTDGTYTEYITSTGNTSFRIRGNDDFIGSIDNVSVKEVGQDWTLGTGWSIGDDKAIQDGTGSNFSIEQTSVFVVGKQYKVNIEVLTLTQGQLEIYAGFPNTNIKTINSVGSYTFYIEGEGNGRFYAKPVNNFIGSITNISVIEITDDTNLPRIDYSPYSGAGTCGHWLFEPQSTNLMPYSEDATNWSTQSNSVLATSNQAVSPDGTLNADKLIPASGSVTSNGGRYLSFASTASTDYSVSIFVKQAEYRYVTFSYGSTAAYGFHFDLQDGVIIQELSNAQYTSISREVESFTNGWYRLKISLTDTISQPTRFISVRPANELPTAINNNYATTGDGTSGIYVWGFQIEQGSYATSYIPTSGSTVTRNQDLAFGSGSSSLINSTEGVLYAEIAALADDNITRNISLGSGTIANTVEIFYGTGSQNISFRVRANNSVVGSVSGASVTDRTQFAKVALKYKSGEIKGFINGLQVLSITDSFTFSASLSELAFDRGANFSYFEGKTKCVAVFKEALTDDELECLTSDETSFSSFNALALANNYTII